MKHRQWQLETQAMSETLRKRFDTDVQNNKIYSKVHMDENFGTPQKIICPSCGIHNLCYRIICINCKNELPKCKICNKHINGDNISYCPYCDTPYHIDEFFAWLKTKANCPSCKKDLNLWELQKLLVSQSQIENTSSNLCPNCKKVLPEDSKICIHCGAKF